MTTGEVALFHRGVVGELLICRLAMASSDADGDGAGGVAGRDRRVAALVGSLALVLPFLVVEIPPITDLPQQTAQIRLLGEALGGSADYRVQWLHPNQLGYLPILLLWPLGALDAGRLGVAVLVAAWSLAAHALAAERGRAPGAALLGSLFALNAITYWGFLGFLSGLPVFVALWCLLGRRERTSPRARGDLLLAGLALLLYAAHVLWLAAGTAWIVASGILDRTARRRLPRRFVATLPAWTAVALWYPRLAEGGFVSATFWGGLPHERLDPRWLASAALGGLRGPLEGATLAVVGLWIAVGLWHHRREPGRGVDRRLLVTAALFALAAITLPGVHQHTIFFAARWLPVAALLAVVALPAPRAPTRLPAGRSAVRHAWTAAALLATLAFGVATAFQWQGFERDELDGLADALATTPPGSRVLGLDLVRTSERVEGYPFFHLYAWTQALHGGELARSFANEASSLVVFRDLPRRPPWSEGLDWRATRLRRSDLPHFDVVIVHAAPALQDRFTADPILEPLTPPARWRLYRVLAAAPEARSDGTSRPRIPSSAATSASVLVTPKLTRSEARATASSTPMARSARLGEGRPSWQAEPVDTAWPAASRRAARAAPERPGKAR